VIWLAKHHWRHATHASAENTKKWELHRDMKNSTAIQSRHWKDKRVKKVTEKQKVWLHHKNAINCDITRKLCFVRLTCVLMCRVYAPLPLIPSMVCSLKADSRQLVFSMMCEQNVCSSATPYRQFISTNAGINFWLLVQSPTESRWVNVN